MVYALFRCCVTASHLPEFDTTTESLLSRLGVASVTVAGFGCCGYPLKNINLVASLTAAARNLALAERAQACILTSCACCHGTLRHAAHLLSDPSLRQTVNNRLAREDLTYTGRAEVRHLVRVLEHEVGCERIARETAAVPGLRNVAVHYGCKLLRPALPGADARRLDAVVDDLVAAAGISPAPWGMADECCGSPISTTDQALSATVGRTKMEAARRADADGVVVACPFCLLQLRKTTPDGIDIPVIAISQLLEQGLGIASGT